MFKNLFEKGQIATPTTPVDSVSEVDNGAHTNSDLHNQMLDELPESTGVEFAREFLRGKISDEDLDILYPAQLIAVE